MAGNGTYIFDKTSQTRVAKAVRGFETTPIDRRGVPVRRLVDSPATTAVVLVLLIDSVGCAGGYYRGQVLNPPTAAISPSTGLTVSAMGTTSSDLIYLQNPSEEGHTTNNLAADGSALPRVFGAIYRGQTIEIGSETYPVYTIFGAIQGLVCNEDGTDGP